MKKKRKRTTRRLSTQRCGACLVLFSLNRTAPIWETPVRDRT